MLGVLITLLFAVGAIGVGGFLVGRWTGQLDRAEAIGVHGLIGLGALGLLTLFIGLLPEGLHWGIIVVGALALLGYGPILAAFKRGEFKFAKPEGPSLLFILAILVAGIFALVGALAPSDTLDWDTLAYHLAVPKLWLQAGQIQYISTIHHSNFPFTVEDLYIWGLTWGGQSGAKAFSLAFFVFGVLALFGIARSRYSGLAGWWAALTFATVPVVLWESGTGYIDVAHGLFGGLGVLYAARYLGSDRETLAGTNHSRSAPPISPSGGTEKPTPTDSHKGALWLSAIFLGLAAGSKYTGLQTIAVVCLVLVIAFAVRKQVGEGVRSAVLVGLIAMAVAGPWYVKNVIQTGNPVYPFFFEKLGGHDWDQRRADVYRVEQQKFGAGTEATRHSPTELGNAVLGLAYQPGRYVNPAEDRGLGTPLGAIGIVIIATGLLWALSGKLGSFEAPILGVVGLSLLMWFFLSQQSRYVVPLAVPLAVLAGGAVVRLKIGKFLAGVVVLQAAVSLALMYTMRFQDQSQVVFGKVSAEDYQTHTIGFYQASQVINKEVAGGQVALYDEVFGYLLNVPYMWANPPHSTLIPYDSLSNGASYAFAMQKKGFTHIYINLSSLVKDPAFAQRWLSAMGISLQRGADGIDVVHIQPVPFPEAERHAMYFDANRWQDKWEIMLSDAVAQGLIVPVKAFNHGILFKIQ